MANDKLHKKMLSQLEKNTERIDEEDKFLALYGGTFLEYRDGYRFFIKLLTCSCYLTVAIMLISFGIYFSKAPSEVYVTTYSGELYRPVICEQRVGCVLNNEKQ